MKEELGKQRLIRGTKGSRKDTLTEEGMILRKRSEEILDLVKKTEHEIMLSDNVMIGVVYIGAGETDGVRLPAKDVWGILIPKDSRGRRRSHHRQRHNRRVSSPAAGVLFRQHDLRRTSFDKIRYC